MNMPSRIEILLLDGFGKRDHCSCAPVDYSTRDFAPSTEPGSSSAPRHTACINHPARKTLTSIVVSPRGAQCVDITQPNVFSSPAELDFSVPICASAC